MDFNVNVNVKFDATPSLVGAVSSLADAIRPAAVLQPVIPAPAIVQEQESKQEPEQPIPAAPVVQEQQEPPVTAEQSVQTTQSEKQGEITDEMLRKIVGPVSKAKGKEAVFAILDEFGVKRVPDLKQEQRQAFIDKVNAL